MRRAGIKNLSQLAKMANVPRSSMYAMARGEMLMNNPDYIKRIAKVLKVKPEDLY
jgi:predicted transcriptional regulator